jgi:putative ABC transport system permease protein
MLAIKPSEFGKTATFDTSLLPHHWYNYLNLMSDSPSAVLASSAFKKQLKAKEGDIINISYGKRKSLDCIIYAFVDYWPSLNPNRKLDKNPAPFFIVSNLDYVQNVRSLEPYQIWIKKKPDVSNNVIYNAMTNKKIELTMCNDMNEQLVKKKNDPFLQGTNGSLSLGFIITIIICIIGFLTYWIMSIKKRVLQFGIFRAMGLTLKNIIEMIACEQLMVTGSAVLGGIFIGGLTSKIFVPLLQIVYSAEDQVPPFRVVTYLSDYTRMFVIFALMLLVCFTVLSRFVKKINIGQALKLGED